jgi:hypothetical protein
LLTSFHFPSFNVDFDCNLLQLLTSTSCWYNLQSAANFGTTRFLVVSLSVWGFIFMIFGLGIVFLTLVLQVVDQHLSFLYQSHHFSNPKPSHLVTKGGTLSKPLSCYLHPKVTQEASLVVESSITKMRGVIAKVTVVFTPSCVSHLLLLVEFSLMTLCAIT